MRTSKPCPEEWVRICETHIRAGELTDLEVLLEHPPTPNCELMKMFYQARIAVARASYKSASRLFQEIITTARTTAHYGLQEDSLIWLAYCHTVLGNYALARTCLQGVTQVISIDSRNYALVVFIRGLLACETGTMAEAQSLFEQAYNLAWQHQDRWLEARCCTNCAIVCMSQGLMSQSERMIQQVEQINKESISSPQQLFQVRNIEVYRLRLMGELEQALQVALPLPEDLDNGSLHYRGWLALTAATVATDAGNFVLAEELWQQAASLIERVQDNISIPELIWERAWLRFRQNRLDEAFQDIRHALNLIEPGTDSEHFHALVIAAIIDMSRDDIGLVDLYLREASDHFRRTKHDVGLASVLVHIAVYHLRGSRESEARKVLVEALTLLREHQLYGAYYWHPPTMVTLCKLAIQEDWGDQMEQLTAHPLMKGVENFYLRIHPKDVLGDFAASLATRRLATQYWEEFVPLLKDTRPQVRRRAAQVLRAARNRLALENLDCLRHDPEPYLRQWYSQFVAPQRGPAVVVHSFGRFEILIDGKPLKLHNAGTRKAKALFGVLLLAGERGIESDEVALLLWPSQPEKQRRASLQAAVSVLRRIMKSVLDGDDSITFSADTRRYSLHLPASGIWWDWDQLRQVAETAQHAGMNVPMRQEIETRYHEAFMEDFLNLLPRPQGLDEGTNMRWNAVHDAITEMVEEHEGKAALWMQQFDQERQSEKAGGS